MKGYAQPLASGGLLLMVVAGSVSCSGERSQASNDGRVTCGECAVGLSAVGYLDDSDDPGLLPDRMVYVVQRGDGVMITPSRDATSLLIFSASGKLIRRVGRAGEAPGEFRRIRRVMLGPSDSLYVSDWGLGRLMVYGPSLELVRVQSLDYLPSLILPDGRMVVVEHILKPDLIGYPIHVLNASGALERSFGIDVPESAYDAKLATTRLVASTPAGTIWSVAPGRYVLEHWDPSTGTRLDSFEIDSRDIVPIRKWPDDERLRPPGIIESLWSGDNGWLFLVLRVADEQWKVPARANIERAISADEYDQTYDWAIEVVDPVARRVVARARYPTALWGRPSSGVLVSVDQTDEFTRTKYSILKPAIKSSEVTQ